MLFDIKRTTHRRQRAGSALILVVVLTVLLSAVGILFVLMSRLDEMTSSALSTQEELDAGVDAVVSKIEQVLMDDLDDVFDYYNTRNGGGGDRWDLPSADDEWLASLEPVRIYGTDTPEDTSDDVYVWPRITDLYGALRGIEGGQWVDPDDDTNPDQWQNDPFELYPWGHFRVKASDVPAKVLSPDERMWVVLFGADADKTLWLPGDVGRYGGRADADGDGVADSRWVLIPYLSGSKGETFYAAVRIVSNGDKLNLNTAHSFKTSDPNDMSRGEYLSELDYELFLKGADSSNPGDLTGVADNIRAIRMGDGIYAPLVNTAARYHNEALMNIENPGLGYNLFNIGDELEIANRYMLTSPTNARFETTGAAHFTFDADGGLYSRLEVPIESNLDTHFRKWKWRVDHRNFGANDLGTAETHVDPNCPEPYKYDRRHVCTFYSFDKLWRRDYPLVAFDAFEVTNSDVDEGTVHEAIKPGYVADLGGGVFYTISDVFMPFNGPASIRGIFMVDTTLVADEADRYILRKQCRKNVLHLLYALRAHFINETDPDDLSSDPDGSINNAAVKAAQTVANMIDYIDGESDTMEGPFFDDDTSLFDFGGQKNEDPTYIDRDIIRNLILEASGGVIDIGLASVDILPEYDFGLTADDEDDEDIWGDTVYGYERQPFITEMYTENDEMGNNTHFGFELYNPYEDDIYLSDETKDVKWRIVIGDYIYDFDGSQLSEEQRKIEGSHGGGTGRLVMMNNKDVPVKAGTPVIEDALLVGALELGTIVRLQRLNPKWDTVGDPDDYEFITVDRTYYPQTHHLTHNKDGVFVSKRDDRLWRFADGTGFLPTSLSNTPLTPTLGDFNDVDITWANGFQLPVANDDVQLMTLNDLEYVLHIGNRLYTDDDPNMVLSKPITDQIARVTGELDVRFDIEETPELLDYVFFMNRSAGNLPGRININTASKEVIKSAIVPDDQWDVDKLVDDIIEYRQDNGPFKNILELAKVDGFDGGSYLDPNTPIGDIELEDDIEKRDWLMSRVANIFTVRSDVFTAYILVKLGEDGPQKRMIAIFDRSMVRGKSDRPRLVALHPVPDPR